MCTGYKEGSSLVRKVNAFVVYFNSHLSEYNLVCVFVCMSVCVCFTFILYVVFVCVCVCMCFTVCVIRIV